MGTEHSSQEDSGAQLAPADATAEEAAGDIQITIEEGSSVPSQFEIPTPPPALASRLELGGASAEEDETTSPGVPAFRLPEDEEVARPRSIVPRPEGYRGSLRSSAPPPKGPPSGRLLRREDAPRFDLGVAPASVPPPAGNSNGTALQPMRMIEVKSEGSSPPPMVAEPFAEMPFGETPNLPPVMVRPPAEPAQRSRLSEPPPLPGSLQPAVPALRIEPPLPSAPRVEPPVPSAPRAEPPLPPGSARRISVQPPLEPPLPSSPRASSIEPPPLPGGVPSRPAPGRIPSRHPRAPSGEPPPLPRQPVSAPAPGSPVGRGAEEGFAPDGSAQTLRASGVGAAPAGDVPSIPWMGTPGAAKFGEPGATAEGAEELELESIPPPVVEGLVPEPPAEARQSPTIEEVSDPAATELGGGLLAGGPRRSFPGASPSAHQMEPGAQALAEDVNSEGTESASRSRPRPPAPPTRGRAEGAEVEVGVSVEVAVTVEAPVSENAPDVAGDQGRPPPRRRLPRTPPPRTGFTGAHEDDSGKRRHWWDEIFSDDFLRADMELTESQFLAEVNFIQESLGVEKGGLVLDLACGGGRHTIELARRGYTAVGYDLSLSQLARAGERAQRSGTKVSFLHGDMRELAFEPTFDGIFCWNAGFGYFEEEKNQAVLRNVYRALKPGGSFLLDIPNRDFVVSQQPNQNWFEGDGCVCMDDMQVDFITSRLVVKRTIMLDDGRNRECTYSIRLYGLHELGRMLHEAGFRVAEVTGHIAMRGVFMGATSPRLILVVTKP